MPPKPAIMVVIQFMGISINGFGIGNPAMGGINTNSEQYKAAARDNLAGIIEAEMMMKELKEEILEKMEEKGFQESFETNGLKVTYKKASTRSSIDSKKLKEEEPSVYEKYLKESPVKSSISLEFLW